MGSGQALLVVIRPVAQEIWGRRLSRVPCPAGCGVGQAHFGAGSLLRLDAGILRARVGQVGQQDLGIRPVVMILMAGEQLQPSRGVRTQK